MKARKVNDELAFETGEADDELAAEAGEESELEGIDELCMTCVHVLCLCLLGIIEDRLQELREHRDDDQGSPTHDDEQAQAVHQEDRDRFNKEHSSSLVHPADGNPVAGE